MVACISRSSWSAQSRPAWASAPWAMASVGLVATVWAPCTALVAPLVSSRASTSSAKAWRVAGDASNSSVTRVVSVSAVLTMCGPAPRLLAALPAAISASSAFFTSCDVDAMARRAAGSRSSADSLFIKPNTTGTVWMMARDPAT